MTRRQWVEWDNEPVGWPWAGTADDQSQLHAKTRARSCGYVDRQAPEIRRSFISPYDQPKSNHRRKEDRELSWINQMDVPSGEWRSATEAARAQMHTGPNVSSTGSLAHPEPIMKSENKKAVAIKLAMRRQSWITIDLLSSIELSLQLFHLRRTLG